MQVLVRSKMSSSAYLKSLIRDLKPLDVFEYYDGPKFYSCQDRLGQLFLVYWIDQSENSDASSWLYLRVSKERYDSLKSGVTPVALALANPEEDIAFVVVSSNQDFEVNEILKDKISESWLPPDDYKLDLPTQTLPAKTTSAQDVARRNNRQVIDIAFDKTSNRFEMAAGKLGQILSSIQSLIDALACDERSNLHRVPEVTKFKSELLVTGLYASSFGVRLQSKGGSLFDSDETSHAIESLAKLIATLQVPESIAEELHSFNVLARSRFKNLLNKLIDAQVSIKTDWGAPSGRTLDAIATYSEILQAFNKLESTEDVSKDIVTLNGELVGVNIESSFFALKVESKEIIKGSLSQEVSHRVFDVPSKINAKVEEICKIDSLTDKEIWTYTLMDFKLADS